MEGGVRGDVKGGVKSGGGWWSREIAVDEDGVQGMRWRVEGGDDGRFRVVGYVECDGGV